MAKEYFATKAMQDTTNTRLEELVAEMTPPNLSNVITFMIDFTDPSLIITAGGLDTDSRTINA